MDILLVNDKLLVLDYERDKEYVVEKNSGTFIKSFFTNGEQFSKAIQRRLGERSITHRKKIGHKFSLLYSEKRYVNYFDLQAVTEVEDKATARHEIYKETFSSHEIIGDYYFLNPILFKNKLAKEDLLGAILYFSSGIKCSAKFNSQSHIKKFIPSNGARYPFFPVIYINNGGNITPGVYKYHPYLHSLIRFKDNQHSKDFDIRIIFKGTVERVMSRYPNGVAYQDLLFDLGHLITTLKMCFSHYGISYTLRTSIDANSEVNLMDLELLTIDLRINT